VISATLSELVPVITGAIGVRQGPLHGGANTEVLKTGLEIGDVAMWPPTSTSVRSRTKENFMGFGHAGCVTRSKPAWRTHERTIAKAGDRTGAAGQWY